MIWGHLWPVPCGGQLYINNCFASLSMFLVKCIVVLWTKREIAALHHHEHSAFNLYI